MHCGPDLLVFSPEGKSLNGPMEDVTEEPKDLKTQSSMQQQNKKPYLFSQQPGKTQNSSSAKEYVHLTTCIPITSLSTVVH